MRDTGISIRKAHLADIPTLSALLKQVGLSSDDILADGTRYWLAEDAHRQVVGVVGLELGQRAVLLRSAAVSPAHQGQGLGTKLVLHAMDEATGYQHVYLFSTEAGTYWQRLHFREVPVSELVAALPTTPQVKRYEMLGWLPTEVAWRRDVADTD